MIIQYHGSATDTQKKYFESKLEKVKKYLGNLAGDEDTVRVHVSIDQGRHKSGKNIQVKAHMTAAHHAEFFAQVDGSSIEEAADLMRDGLQAQAVKFHQKHTR